MKKFLLGMIVISTLISCTKEKSLEIENGNMVQYKEACTWRQAFIVKDVNTEEVSYVDCRNKGGNCLISCPGSASKMDDLESELTMYLALNSDYTDQIKSIISDTDFIQEAIKLDVLASNTLKVKSFGENDEKTISIWNEEERILFALSL